MLCETSRHPSIRAALVIAMLLGVMAAAVGKGKPQQQPPLAESSTQMQIFGVWHCGSHFCDWNEDINIADSDRSNHWLIERGTA